MANRYEILDLLATGGMAEIYRARSIGAGGFQKPVVVKKILPSFTSDPEFVRMFIEEAKLAAELHHGNIVHVYDLGTTGSGEYFIVMELVHGHDLGDVLHDATRQGISFGLGEAIFIARQVCAGLEYAHRKLDPEGKALKIVHRDVSPQNVLISFEGEVKLTDFGIAKARSRTAQTQVGFLKGKYGYMSPEQARGEHLDQRSDIFNVGILLYELLAGERLFQGSNDFSTLNQMRNVEMVPLERLRADLPEGLVSIAHQALAAQPEDRFQSAAKLDQALARLSFETSLGVSAGDLSALMERIYGRPSSKPGKLTATRVIDLEGLPASDLISASGDEVGTPAPPGGWADDAPAPAAARPSSEPRPPTVSMQPARRTVLPPREPTGLTRIIPPLPPWARGLFTLGLSLLAFTLGVALLWPWQYGSAERSLPVGGALAPVAVEGSHPSSPRRLLVRSRPAVAAVTLDGELRARSTPALLTLADPTGTPALRITAEGYRAWKGTAPAASDEEGDLGQIEASLQRRTTALKVRTRPSRAALSLDGKPAGHSPRTLELTPGPHRLRATKKGYLRAVAELEAPGRRRLELTLPRRGEAGVLQVLTYPPATIRVGPRRLKVGKKGERLQLPAGVYTLRAEAEPLPPRELQVEVLPGQVTRVFVDLVLSSPRP